MCIRWRNALHKVWELPYGSHRNVIPMIAECVPLDVDLVFRFIQFYRIVALSDNMVFNYNYSKYNDFCLGPLCPE